jgi:protein TonB
MRRDLFGDMATARPGGRMRRAWLVVFSIALHAVAVVVVGLGQLLAIGALPEPHRRLAYTGGTRPIRLLDIDLPPAQPRAPERPAREVARTRAPSAAPLTAPAGIEAETGREGAPAAGPASPIGIEDGGIGLPADLGFAAELPPQPPLPQPPIRLHGGIEAPRKLVDVVPVYPALARAARVQGVVILEATIDVGGHVVSARVLRSVPLLDGSALDAVRQWKFTPTRLNGVPVPIVMTVTVNFTLAR